MLVFSRSLFGGKVSVPGGQLGENSKFVPR